MTALSGEILLRLLQRHVRLGEMHHAADSVVDDGRKIVGELVLQHEAEAIGIKVLAGIGKSAGRDIGQEESARGARYAGAEEGWIDYVVGIGGDLKPIFADTPRQTHFVMMSALHLRSEVEQADSRIRFAEIGRG